MSKKRWLLFTGLVVVSLTCGLSVLRLGAASPTSGTIIGPSLKSQLPEALDDTTLEVYDANGVPLELNDDWQQSAGAAQVQAAGLAPSSPAESAVMLPSVAPGSYTAVLRGKNGTTGVGLVDVFHLP